MPAVAENRAAAAVVVPRMIDVIFSIEADVLPVGYRAALDAALLDALPWLASAPGAAVHALRGARTEQGWVVSKRTRLVVRLPAACAEAARELCGRTLLLGGSELAVGPASVREVAPCATLKAALVLAGEGDEAAFVAYVEGELATLGIKAELICGKPGALTVGERRIEGFAVALHGLSPAHSLLLQAAGIGPERRLGCGLFVHHKPIEGLDAYPE